MKAYLRRVAISATALFLLIALVAPVISASEDRNEASTSAYTTTSSINQGYYAPVEPVYKYPDEQEPEPEPELEPEVQVEPAQETEKNLADMPQEDEESTSPDFYAPLKTNGNGKSIPPAIGFWRNLLRKV